jgi:hypothetical protein
MDPALRLSPLWCGAWYFGALVARKPAENQVIRDFDCPGMASLANASQVSVAQTELGRVGNPTRLVRPTSRSTRLVSLGADHPADHAQHGIDGKEKRYDTGTRIDSASHKSPRLSNVVA